MRRALAIAAILLLPAAAQADGDAAVEKPPTNAHLSLDQAGREQNWPSLYGILGRPAHSAPNYIYSEAMKDYNATWTKAGLDKYLDDPAKLYLAPR